MSKSKGKLEVTERGVLKKDPDEILRSEVGKRYLEKINRLLDRKRRVEEH